MDDLLIYSQTKEKHQKHIKLVFVNFEKFELNWKMSKCEFFKSEIEI